MNTETTTRTAEDIRNDIAKLEGELSALSGEGLLVWDGMNGDICDCPPGGATLSVEWAVSDHSYTLWFPSTEAAKAALAAIARHNGRQVDRDGFYVDLTSPGCYSSSAHVTRLGPSTLREVSRQTMWDYAWRGRYLIPKPWLDDTFMGNTQHARIYSCSYDAKQDGFKPRTFTIRAERREGSQSSAALLNVRDEELHRWLQRDFITWGTMPTLGLDKAALQSWLDAIGAEPADTASA